MFVRRQTTSAAPSPLRDLASRLERQGPPASTRHPGPPAGRGRPIPPIPAAASAPWMSAAAAVLAESDPTRPPGSGSNPFGRLGMGAAGTAAARPSPTDEPLSAPVPTRPPPPPPRDRGGGGGGGSQHFNYRRTTPTTSSKDDEEEEEEEEEEEDDDVAASKLSGGSKEKEGLVNEAEDGEGGGGGGGGRGAEKKKAKQKEAEQKEDKEGAGETNKHGEAPAAATAVPPDSPPPMFNIPRPAAAAAGTGGNGAAAATAGPGGRPLTMAEKMDRLRQARERRQAGGGAGGGGLAAKMAAMREARERKKAASKGGRGRMPTQAELDAAAAAAQGLLEDPAAAAARRAEAKAAQRAAREARKVRRKARRAKEKEKRGEWKAKHRAKSKARRARRDAEKAERARIAAGLPDPAASGPGGGGSGDDDSDDDSDSEEEGEEEEEDLGAKLEAEAMKRAEKGDFVGDICIVCAFGLPKVDYWGSCDSYVKPMWDADEEEEEVMLEGIKWDMKKNRGKGAEVRVPIIGKNLAVMNSQMPRYDFHFQVDFRKQTKEDATLRLEVWDYDKRGDDDLVSMVTLDAAEVRERCCSTIGNRKQAKFPLQAKPDANKKEAKWGVGTLTLQFKLAEQVNYMAEAQKKAFGRTRASYISEKIRGAREDYAV